MAPGHDRAENGTEASSGRFGALSKAWSQIRELPLGEWRRVMDMRARQIAALVAMNLAATILDVCMLALLVPMLQGAVLGSFGWLDGWFGAERGRALLALAALAFALSVLKNGVIHATQIYNARLYGQYSRNLAVYAFERFLGFGKSYFDKRETGHLNSLIERHHDVVNLFQPVLQAISITLLLAGHFSIMLWISWRLTLVASLLFPVLALASRWVVERTSAAQEAIRRDDQAIGGSVWRVLGSLPLFRAFAREDRALAEFRELSERRRANSLRLWRARSLSARVLDVAVQGSVLAMLTFAFAFESHGPAEMTRLLVFFFVARAAVPQVARYHELAVSLAEKLPGAREFATLSDPRDKFVIPEGTKEWKGLSDCVEFRSLGFQYPDGPVALADVSFRMEKGTMTAVVGPTGAGKSTLANLLLRLYDVPPGTVLIDGCDIREFTFASLRRNISVVSQDVLLLNRSLRENLVFGAEGEVSDETLWRAVSGAQLGDWVESLPAGLDTTPGERGLRLSGGERQRAAIARALIKSAPLLILDEATSSLDSLTEARLQEAIASAIRGCTSLVIAHRLSTIRAANRIVVLDGGRIAEQGTLDELLGRKGLFHRMWKHQAFR